MNSLRARNLWARSLHAAAGAALFAVFSACGGGGDSTSPPPPPPDNTVASVTVSPGSATIDVAATVQLAAVPRNAAGTALTGKSITWTSEPSAVATVSTAGLVTGVTAGSAVVTATIDGRSGTATITVNQGTSQVIARGTIGPAGGTVSSPDVGITIPAGAFTSARSIEILMDDDGTNPFGTYGAAGEFRLNGFPAGATKVAARVRFTAPLDGVSLIAYGTTVRSFDEDAPETLSYRMYPARDSSGWLVTNITVFGRSAVTGALRSEPGVAPQISNSLLDGYLTGVKSADTVNTAHFQVVSYGAPRAELQPTLAKYAQYIEEAYNAVKLAGYSYSYRKEWPVSVAVHPFANSPGTYGFFARPGEVYPLDSEHGYFEFNSLLTNKMHEWPATAIHEFFHFTQAQYVVGANEARELDFKWLKEATSTWIEEKAPSSQLTFKNTFFRSYRDSIFNGFHGNLNAKGGYGRSAIVKYVVDRWGDDIVRAAFGAYHAGGSTTQAFLEALPEGAATWWPEFVVAYLGSQVYSLGQDELLPASAGAIAPLPGWSFSALQDRKSASVRVFRFNYDAASLGTGTKVVLRFRTADSASFRIMVFQANDAGGWTPLAPIADTAVVTGATLKQGRNLVFVALRPDAVAPYTSAKTTYLAIEMGIEDGDWLADDIRDVDDQVVYTRTGPSDNTKIDVADNVEEVARLLGSAGFWKHSDQPRNEWTWTPLPGVADTLAKYGIKLSSKLEVAPGTSDFVLKSRLEMGVGTALQSREASLWWFLLPLGVTPLLWKRRTRRVGTIGVLTLTATVLACDLGSILFAAKINYEFQLPKAALAYTADAADSSVAAVTYTGVTGKMTVEEYRSEYWEYIRDDQGEKVDSVRRVRTGVGTATFKADLKLHYDGKTPKDDDASAIAARLSQLGPAAFRYLKR